MSTTTILSEDSAAIVTDEARPSFNWSATIAGAFAATAVTFFLVTLGSGVGLSLASVRGASGTGAAVFLTLGAIYFFAAQAFGFAVGGHLTGRLIGPALESAKEEEFRAGAHGFVMWALAVVASLAILGLSTVLIAKPATTIPSAANGYWVDMMFRPAANDARIAGDKAEAGRILAAAAIKKGADAQDSARMAQLVSRDAGLSMTAAMQRVSDVESAMRTDALHATRAAGIVSLWTALALLFGAFVAVAAAISARWEDDRLNFSMARRY
jgi:hypothetical protein